MCTCSCTHSAPPPNEFYIDFWRNVILLLLLVFVIIINKENVRNM